MDECFPEMCFGYFDFEEFYLLEMSPTFPFDVYCSWKDQGGNLFKKIAIAKFKRKCFIKAFYVVVMV
jgi:hypothetical protein